ncbi:hypothetical protein ARMSODRAFT_979458 [Armillaria solidipes]|uniref:Uncharacterized protein n=1 Tax=Armillaria solidipes TaxID=1076256 RepID=A0A2H3BJQ3_9AGAR|nr:hypothetical protein ARMSODRAFT_979458 [Armillaria solidipes]
MVQDIPSPSLTSCDSQTRPMSLPSIILSFAPPGTVLYTLILVFLPCYFFLYPLLPAVKPSSALEKLKKSLKDATHLYTSHIRAMDDPVAFHIAVEEIELSTAGLTRVYLNACHRLSWTDRRSWARYLSDAKHVWLKAREYQREIDSLKKRLERKKEEFGTPFYARELLVTGVMTITHWSIVRGITLPLFESHGLFA